MGFSRQIDQLLPATPAILTAIGIAVFVPGCHCNRTEPGNGEVGAPMKTQAPGVECDRYVLRIDVSEDQFSAHREWEDYAIEQTDSQDYVSDWIREHLEFLEAGDAIRKRSMIWHGPVLLCCKGAKVERRFLLVSAIPPTKRDRNSKSTPNLPIQEIDNLIQYFKENGIQIEFDGKGEQANP